MLIETAIVVLGVYVCHAILDTCGRFAFVTFHFRPLNYQPISVHINDISSKVKCNTDEDCSICLDPLNNRKIRKTICGHYFCHNCLQEWIQINPKCPNCNKNFLALALVSE